jgi:hypothetical protein
MLNIIVVRHDIPILEGGSLASYIDTQNAFPSVHSAAPQLPLTQLLSSTAVRSFKGLFTVEEVLKPRSIASQSALSNTGNM